MTLSTAGDVLLKGHVRKIVEAILAGKVVPFLGADVNLCDRPKTADGHNEPWSPDSPYPPSNQELAAYLDLYGTELGTSYLQQLSCPFAEMRELEQLPAECPLRRGGAVLRLPVQNVSQNLFTNSKNGATTLYDALSSLFEKVYTPNSLHRFFAKLPNLLRSRSHTPVYPLIVTSCFDSTLERAFAEAGEEIDLVSFIREAKNERFQHQSPDGKRTDITDPNKYSNLDLNKRPVVLKLYGGYESGSFQITEDDYIDYLSHRDMAELIPSSLLRILRADNTTMWFLGYALSLWNQRVILRRLWQEKLETSEKPWWAIQAHPDPMDLQIWDRYSVQTLQRPPLCLEDYIGNVEDRLQATPTLAPAKSNESTSQATLTRDKVFFSYSHEDQDWLQQLKVILAPAVRAGLLSEWDDLQIQPGAQWRDEIQAALSTAKVAVLLVSPRFLESEFIASEELPILLQAAKDDGVVICPVIVDHCLYSESALGNYQAANAISKPLMALEGAERSEELTKIARKILTALKKEKVES
jgi:hypothetical protein